MKTIIYALFRKKHKKPVCGYLNGEYHHGVCLKDGTVIEDWRK